MRVKMIDHLANFINQSKIEAIYAKMYLITWLPDEINKVKNECDFTLRLQGIFGVLMAPRC